MNTKYDYVNFIPSTLNVVMTTEVKQEILDALANASHSTIDDEEINEQQQPTSEF